MIATGIASPAQIFTTVYSFCSLNDCPDGANPDATVVEGTDGNFYGTTAGGGTQHQGTVFKITPQGVLTTLHSFCSEQYCTDGQVSFAGLVQATDGNFYGTTIEGGTSSVGTAFQVTPGGVLTTLHSFSFFDGDSPGATLIQGTDGDLYGTTPMAGANGRGGTIFRMTLQGSLAVLHSFCANGCSDGASPASALVQANDGNFYGTTGGGGAFCIASGGCGTIFKITPQGSLTTLHSFNGADGNEPYAGLVQGIDGNFYGATYQGGAYCTPFGGCGTVYKVTPLGVLTTLHSFSGPDGNGPAAGLVQGADGNFYGTTTMGGPSCSRGSQGCGTIFRITPEGAFTTLYNFTGQDGASPQAGLALAKDGSFYGTTGSGGSNCGYYGCGTVFNLVAYAALAVTKSGMGTVSGGHGKIYCGTMCSSTYGIGDQLTLSAVPAPGYTFTAWTGCDNANGSYCYVTMSAAKNVSATFTTANIILTSLTFKPSYVRGGQLSAGTLTLNAPAPPGGVSVALSSDHPAAAHPPSFVFVPGGKSSVQFAVTTFPVKSKTTVMITATAGASHVSGTLTVGTMFAPPALR